MLKFRGTYEIMSPETIGLTRKDEAGIVLGKHSGRHALTTSLKELGYNLEKDELQVSPSNPNPNPNPNPNRRLTRHACHSH